MDNTTNEQFKKWYREYYLNPKSQDAEFTEKIMQDFFFDEIPFSMQWGVYLQFFDSINIKIEIFNDVKSSHSSYWIALINDEHAYKGYKDSRELAEQAAVNKAFKMINV